MFGKTKGCPILLTDVRYNWKMFDLKDAEIKDDEAEMILQNRKWYYYVPRLLANFIRENKIASAVAATWLPET